MVDSVTAVNNPTVTASGSYTTSPVAAAQPNASIFGTGSTAPQPFVKTGESIDERLSRYYAKYKYAKTIEEKEAFLDRYLTGSYAAIPGKTKEEQIRIQLADYKKLLSNTTDPQMYELLAKKISILEAQNQVSAAKAATVEQSDAELKARGEVGVAKAIPGCADENQLELAGLVKDSKNEEAIVIASSTVSQYADKNQAPAVQIYTSAEISDEAKKEVGDNIVDQYGKFDKSAELPIHQVVSNMDIPEVVKRAAESICKLNSENQAEAVQITLNTEDVEAIVAAASKYNEYDDETKASIKDLINNSKYTEAQSELAGAELSAAQASYQAPKDEVQPVQVVEPPKVDVQPVQLAVAVEPVKVDDTKAKIAEIKEAIAGNNDDKIRATIAGLSRVEMVSLLRECPDNITVIRAVLENNPSIQVLAQIDEKYIEKLGYKALLSQVAFLSAGAQTKVVRDSAAAGQLSSVKRCLLLSSVKTIYDKLQNDTEQGKVIC